MKGWTRFSWPILVLAVVSRCESGDGGPTELDESPGASGTITGAVTADGAPIASVEVVVTSLGPAQRVLTDVNGDFTIAVVPGSYAVTVDAPGTTCGSANVIVRADETATVHVACQPMGRIAGRHRLPDGSSIPEAPVVVSGPISRQATASASGSFLFDHLPVGVYIVSGNAAPTRRGACAAVTVTVEVAKLTRVDLDCLPLVGMDLEGTWSLSLPRSDDFGFPAYDQQGDCPPALSEGPTPGSIAFDASSDRLSIEGLDPEMTLVADFDPSGCTSADWRFAWCPIEGEGSVVRADGSSMATSIAGSLGVISPPDDAESFWVDAILTRTHRDPGGALLCTETYLAGGDKS